MKNALPNKNLEVLLNPQNLLCRVLDMSVKLVSADRGSLMLLNPNTGSLDIEASVGLSAMAKRTKLRIGEGITGWVASTGLPYRTGNVHEEKRYVELDSKIQSELAVPLDLKGQVIGILNVDSTRRDAFTQEHEKLLLQLARDASDWIRMAWEINQLRVKGEQLETLVDMGQVIISEEHPESVLQSIARDACRLMKARLCSLMLLSENGEELVLKAWEGASKAYVRKPNLLVSESLLGVVVKRQKPLTVLNVQAHERFQHMELARRERLFSLLSVPLIFEGRSLGVLSVYTEQLHRFSNEEIRLLSAMAGLSAVAIAKVRLLERVVQVEEDLRASERLSALGWLAAEIAHEIRNPLTVVQMLFHSMLSEMKLEGGLARDAALIETKMKQMNRILDQVLTFARSSEPSMEEIDATSLLADVALLIRHTLAERRIEIKMQMSSGPLRIRGDRAQLEQAILNLVLNACQAMPEGGILTLSARYVRSGKQRMVGVGVRDTGEGMSRKRQEELFQPFLSHKKGGTGLGLALVYKTVENHQGRISVKSKLGQGTLFQMTFAAA
ncbi:MAG: GAF domain-containing protein [Methylacidiphilales bacterium]|nr:GAF domain-containing protein [Candidatus Methylacidiphilales bacterium]